MSDWNIWNCNSLHNGEKLFYDKIKFHINTIFDVGVQFESLFTDFNGIVHYFEPNPAHLEKFKNIPKNNKISYINQVGLSEQKKTLYLYPAFDSLHNRILTTGIDNDNEKISVDVITGYQYMNDNNIDLIDFMKIDTECHEYFVLKGFGDKLKNFKIIQFEYGPGQKDSNTTLLECINLLKENGFENFSYLSHNKILVKITDFVEHYCFCNVVCFNKNYDFSEFNLF
jgi:FkbM family methyltransferase